jgi:hypothetical protein
MRILLPFLLALAATAASLNKDQLAEVTYHDANGKLHTLHLQYFIDSQRLQYGVKFAITVHTVQISNCKADLQGMTEEYFAASLSIPEGCNALDIIHQCEAHGANFLFIDAHRASNSQAKLQSNLYQIPVFFVDQSEDLFMMEAQGSSHQYVSIFFLMVR